MKKILVIGGGSIGERHLRCFLNTGRTAVSLCEIREGIRQHIQQKYPVADAFADFDEALAEQFDAAVICTPAHLHVDMAMQLAQRGVALLIEKPLSQSTRNVDQLFDVIKQNNIPASIAYVFHHHPALKQMKAALASDRFGRPVQVVMIGGQHFPLYRPAYREIYYTSHATGGGAIQDALTHMVNAAEWLVGPITKLCVDAEHCLLEDVEVEDTVHMLARHGAILSSFSLNQHQYPNETTLTVLCEDGALRFESHGARWLTCDAPGAEWNIEAEFELERDDLFVAQANAFLDQLDGKSHTACSLSEGLQTLKVNLAALESARTGQWIEL